ncbi:MAG: Crp/Fnr family transcriptional regulator, partial [Synechococcales cyanobacterium]
LPSDQLSQIHPTLIQQLHQFQVLLQILHRRPVEVALWELLVWLSQKFGQAVEQGQMIGFHLTHQEIAETIGTTRVTVTRLLRDFEQQNLIQRLPSHQILIQDKEPLWHYEI